MEGLLRHNKYKHTHTFTEALLGKLVVTDPDDIIGLTENL